MTMIGPSGLSLVNFTLEFVRQWASSNEAGFLRPFKQVWQPDGNQ